MSTGTETKGVELRKGLLGFPLVLVNHDVFNDHTSYMEYPLLPGWSLCIDLVCSIVSFSELYVFFDSLSLTYILSQIRLSNRDVTGLSEISMRILKFAMLMLIWKLIQLKNFLIYLLVSKIMSYFPSILCWWPVTIFFSLSIINSQIYSYLNCFIPL